MELDLKQVARYLGVSQAYVRILVREQRLHPRKEPVSVGSSVVKNIFQFEEIEAFRTREESHFGPRVDRRRRYIIHLRADELKILEDLLKEHLPEVQLQSGKKPPIMPKGVIDALKG